MIAGTFQSIAYIVASLFGFVGVWFLGKWLAKYQNAAKDPQNAQQATDARADTDKENQDLNAQLDKLPK